MLIPSRKNTMQLQQNKAFEHLSDHGPGASGQIINTAEDGFPARWLYRRESLTNPNFESQAYELNGRIQDFIQRPRNPFVRNRVYEAMTTSNFPIIFGDTINRLLLTDYNRSPAINIDWREYINVVTFTDFRERTAMAWSGGDSALDPLTELGEYKERGLRETEWKYRLGKYGNRMAFSFEFFIQDDLNAFQNLGRLLARGARRRENRFATALFVDANGPHASLYKTNHTHPFGGAAFSNIITGNPPFGPDAFQAGLDLMRGAKDENGEPVQIDIVHVVLSENQEVLANKMFLSDEWEQTIDNKVIRYANPYRNRVRVHYNPLIPIIASAANGTTSWFMFADPGNGRPALEVGFLAGFETPQLFQKMPDQQRISDGGGGGGVNLLDGDFMRDELQLKVRMFIGGTRMDPRMTVASNGSGT
jgi:hypothetical protein